VCFITHRRNRRADSSQLEQFAKSRSIFAFQPANRRRDRPDLPCAPRNAPQQPSSGQARVQSKSLTSEIGNVKCKLAGGGGDSVFSLANSKRVENLAGMRTLHELNAYRAKLTDMS
jgi:hypothetical protein